MDQSPLHCLMNRWVAIVTNWSMHINTRRRRMRLAPSLPAETTPHWLPIWTSARTSWVWLVEDEVRTHLRSEAIHWNWIKVGSTPDEKTLRWSGLTHVTNTGPWWCRNDYEPPKTTNCSQWFPVVIFQPNPITPKRISPHLVRLTTFVVDLFHCFFHPTLPVNPEHWISCPFTVIFALVAALQHKQCRQ